MGVPWNVGGSSTLMYYLCYIGSYILNQVLVIPAIVAYSQGSSDSLSPLPIHRDLAEIGVMTESQSSILDVDNTLLISPVCVRWNF